MSRGGIPRNKKKWIKELSLLAQESEFRIIGMTSSGHVRLRRTGMREVIASSSPSDKVRVARQVRTELRRAIRDAGGDQT